MKVLSVIVPCYNEEAALPYFYKEICKTAENMKKQYDLTFEFLFVDDGSKDKTVEILQKFSQEDSRVHYFSFSRNFGKEAAIYAGFSHSTGDFAVLMDADLQHPPSMLPLMYETIIAGDCECAAACRTSRNGEPPLRSFFAHCFYRLINKISDAQFKDGASDFRMMTRLVVEAILQMCEYNRFSKGIFGWVGFRTKWLPYENVERVAGESKWSFWKLLKYSFSGITAFSTVPLSIASLIGILFCFGAFIMTIYIVVKTLLFGEPVAGFPTLICVIMLIGGIQLFCTGILGQYLAKTYLETKHRPVYIVRERDDNK